MLLSKAIENFVTDGVNTVILGCTELPIVQDEIQKRFPDISFVDPMEEVSNLVLDIYKKARTILDNAPADSKNMDMPKNMPKTADDIAQYVALNAVDHADGTQLDKL